MHFDFKKHMLEKMAFEIAKAKSLEEVQEISSKYHHVLSIEEKKKAVELGVELQKLNFQDPEEEMMEKIGEIGANQKEFESVIKEMKRDGRFDRAGTWIGLILSILSLLVGIFPPDIAEIKEVLRHLLELMKSESEGSK